MSLSYSLILLEAGDADYIVSCEIENIWSCVSQAITDNWLCQLDIPLATEIAIIKARKMVAWATLEHDGQLITDKLEHYTPDQEPTAATVDPWARGTVSMRKIPQTDGLFRSRADIDPLSPRTPSLSSFRSSSNGRNTGRKSGGSVTSNSRAATAVPKPIVQDTTGQIIELDSAVDDTNLGSTGYMFDMLQKSKRQASSVSTKAVDVPKGAFDILADEMARTAKELKGKKFTMDKDGKPVPIISIRPEQLPPFAIPLGLNISSPVERPPNQRETAAAAAAAASNAALLATGSDPNAAMTATSATTASNSAAAGADAAKRRKKVVRVAGQRTVEEAYFTASYCLANTLSGGEQIPVVQPGVKVQSVGFVREGPEVPEDPKRATRKQYFSRIASVNSLLSAGDDDSYHSANGSGALSQSHTGLHGGVDKFLSAPDSFEDAAMVPASMLTSTGSLRVLDIDAFEGSRRIENRSLLSQDAETDSYQGQTQGARSLRYDASALPQKPSAKQTQDIALLSGGPDKGRLRDREAPQHMLPPSEKKKLPAPPPGQTTGHGNSPDRDRATDKNRQQHGQSQSQSQSRVVGGQSSSTLMHAGSTISGGKVKKERPDILRQIF